MGSSKSIAASLAEWLITTSAEELPSRVVSDAKWRIVDQVGVCLAGCRDASAAMVEELARERGGTPQATIMGFGGMVPVATAGWANGAIGHVADYDDMHGRAAVHISTVAVPAALAAAEATGASGRDAITAMILGAELALRVATGAPPHQFHARGLHGTGVAGPFAGAAIGSRLFGLNVQEAMNAIGMAGSRSSGLMQTLIDGSWLKRLHPGWAVEGGLTCAALAGKGYTGPSEVVEGKFGLFHALLHGDEDTFQFGEIVADLGSKWLLPETTYKPWPNGVWNHASMDGAYSIVSTQRLSVEDIERIDCFVPPICIPIVCEPRQSKLAIESAYHAKFSLPYSVAMLLIGGGVTVDDYTDAVVSNAEYRQLASRVFCHADESMAPESFPARVEVMTTSGKCFVQDIPAQKGTPLNPMTPVDHRRKFHDNAGPVVGEERAHELLRGLEGLWEAESVGPVLEMTLRKARA